MTSLASTTMSPTKDGTSSLPRRQSSLARPPLRALYDLLIAPMEGVRAPRGREASRRQGASFTAQCPRGGFPECQPSLPSFSASLWNLATSASADPGSDPSSAPN